MRAYGACDETCSTRLYQLSMRPLSSRTPTPPPTDKSGTLDEQEVLDGVESSVDSNGLPDESTLKCAFAAADSDGKYSPRRRRSSSSTNVGTF